MSDRTINFGESETEATYQIQDTDSTGGGNFVVAKDTNANTVLLQYDPGTDTWEYAGDVDMNGGNVSGVGTLTAESVNTDDSIINQSYTDPTGFTQDRKLVGAKPIPTPTAYFSGPAHGEGEGAFIGGTLAPDGRVVFAPRNSSNVGIFDSSDDSYTSGPAHGEGGGAFFGATLAPDGRVVFAPFDSSNVGITSQLLDFAVANGGNK